MLERTTYVKENINEVFSFFSNAENLNKLTPPALGFRIITPSPITIRKGTIIDYKIKLNGIPFRWKSEITVWDPPHLFADEQLKGPYQYWRHEHKFEQKDGGTLITDIVKYRSPGWIFEFIPHHLIVKKKINQIFDFRSEVIRQIFNG